MECKGTFIGFDVMAMIVYFKHYYPDFEFFRHIPRIYDCLLIYGILNNNQHKVNLAAVYSKFL